MANTADDKWTSLEKTKLAVDIAKTIASVLVSLALFWLGQRYTAQNDQQDRIERANAQASERLAQVIRQRVVLWDKMSGDLNDIYAYFLFVGHWKDLSERDIVDRKRRLDKLIFANRPFFSDEFFGRYQGFMGTAFESYGAWAADARLKTIGGRPRDVALKIEPSRFSGADNGAEIHQAYFTLLQTAGSELDVLVEIPVRPRMPTTEELAGR